MFILAKQHVFVDLFFARVSVKRVSIEGIYKLPKLSLHYVRQRTQTVEIISVCLSVYLCVLPQL